MHKGYNKYNRAKYGQNYIKNPALVRKVLRTVSIGEDDTVVEIGPGEGVFTTELLKRVRQVVAIEIDIENIKVLRKKFADEIASNKLVLMYQDALNFDTRFELKKLGVTNYKIVASIPYNISSKLVKHLLLKKPLPQEVYLTVQREFAERVMRRGELLGTLIQSFYTIDIVHHFNRDDFSPVPSVDSVFLYFSLRGDVHSVVLEHFGEYKDFVSSAFVQPIKTVQRYCAGKISKDKLQRLADKYKFKLKSQTTELTSMQWQAIFVATLA